MGLGGGGASKNKLKYNRNNRNYFVTLLQHGVLEPVFYGHLVYKFKIIVGKPNCSDHSKS